MDEKLKSHILTLPHYQMAAIQPQGEIDAEKRVIPMTFTSTNLIRQWWGAYRIEHAQGAMITTRSAMGLPFLDCHDMTRQGGRIENYRYMGEKNTGGDVRFAKTPIGEELWSLHSDKLRLETSIAFRIHGIDEVPPEEMDEEMKLACLEDQCPGYKITKWEPLEGSSVSIPADITVGQSWDYYDSPLAIKMIQQGNYKKLNELIPAGFHAGAGKSYHIIQSEGDITMPDPIVKAPATEQQQLSDQERQDILKKENERRTNIRQYGKKFVGRVANIDQLIEQAEGNSAVSFELFKGTVADQVADSKPIETPATALGLSEQEQKEFSLSRLIHAAALQASGAKDPWKNAGFELECSNEVAKVNDLGANAPTVRQSPKAVKVHIPYEIMKRDIRLDREMLAYAKRHGLVRQDLSVGSATAGGNLKATNLLAGQYIDLPRNLTLLERLGARVLDGLVGDYVFPKQTGAATFGWITNEGDAASETAPTFGTVSLSPKIGGAYVDYTYKLGLQATPAIDGIVQADLLQIADIAIDLAGHHGTAANGQPRGIVNQSGVGSVSGAAIGLEAIIEFITDVMTANSLSGSLAWATNPTVWGLTQTRERWVQTGKPLAESGNTMNGYPLAVSNQIAAGHLFFGDYSQVLVGNWGGYSLLVDPYTASSSGTTRVRVLVAVDIAMRLAAAFSVATDVD